MSKSPTTQRQRSIPVAWIKHTGTDAEAKKRVVDMVSGSAETLLILKKIVSEMITNNNVRCRSVDQYNSPAWAARQADSNGYERALHEVIELLP